MAPRRAILPLLIALGGGLASAVSSSCNRPPVTHPEPPPSATTLRLYAIANLAGALEPCGCQKDMLGGIDHAAQVLANDRSQVGHSLVVAAGPTFFTNPTSAPESGQQDVWKAEAVARSLEQIGLVAWTPGANDFGREIPIERLSRLSGAPWLSANLGGAGQRAAMVVQLGTVRVGLTGVSVPRVPGREAPGPPPSDPEAGLKMGLDRLLEWGTDLRVALLALPRGEALRLIDRVGGFQVAVIGKPYQTGDGSDAPSPPVFVGDTLVIQPANLLQSIAVVELHLVSGDDTLTDAGGIAQAATRQRLDHRIYQLEQRIASALRSGASPEDVAARRRDLERLRTERAALDTEPESVAGSWFKYSLRQVRESAGADPFVSQRILAYYRRVNDFNRVALADRVPPPVPEGQSRYAGGSSCVPCHKAADAFWKKTRHARAYATLVERYTNYNLECVGCHVTGYAKPGGSTAVRVEGLENVQCEVCHGPGALHNQKPGDPSLITLTPDRSLCASQCHHPPHVTEDWSVDEAWTEQLGPGHGEPLPKTEPPADDDEPVSPQEALEMLTK